MRDMIWKIGGGITPLEMEAFKHRTKALDKLKCYKPRRKADDEIELVTMVVMGIYPNILTMGYQGRKHQHLETSMTWAEAVMLNRMTQEELFEEVKLMQLELGLPYYKSPVNDVSPKRKRISREGYVPLVVAYRGLGMTYARIASMLGVSTSFVRDVYLCEGLGYKKHS